MAKMRVLHVQGAMCGGGIETFITTMAAALEDTCETSLFSLAAGCPCEGPYLPTYDQQYACVGRPAVFLRLLRHARQWRPDIIHAHFRGGAFYAALVRDLMAHPAGLVVHWHTTREAVSDSTIARCLGGYALRTASAIVACSSAAAHYHAAANGIPTARVKVLYNPVDTSLYEYAADRVGFRERLQVQEGELLGVFLGRLQIDLKGLDVLCDAARLLPDGFPLRIAMVGPGEVDAVRERLQPPECVTITGPVGREEVPDLLHASDICLQPSRTEGFPLTVIEAMAAGRPVVATRVGGVSEAVEDGVTGVLVQPEDPGALAEALRWICEHHERRAEMGTQARERAKRFDVGTVAANLADIYHEVLDGSGRREAH